MKLSRLIELLQEESRACDDPDPEVMIMIGGRKPDEAEVLDIPDAMDCVHGWGSFIALVPAHHREDGSPWFRRLLSDEETAAWYEATLHGDPEDVLREYVRDCS